MRYLIPFLLLCSSAFGAITYVGGTSPVNSNGGTATTGALDAHTANFLAIWAGTWGTGTSNACSATVADSSGNTYTPTVSDATVATSGCTFCSVVGPTVTSSMTFSVTNASGGWALAIGAAFAGVPAGDICNQTLKATAFATSIQPGSLTPNVAGALLITGLTNYIPSNGTNTIDSGFTVVSQIGSNGVTPDGGLAYLIQTTATAVNPTWSWGQTSNPSAASTMVVVEPPGGPAAPTVTLTTYNHPSWSNWVSMRAGVCTGPQLDGSASHGNNTPSTTVTHFWQQLSGPTQVVWNSRTASQPTICGHIFGTYTFQDTVTDAYGNVASATITTGSVATDSNGVVVNADPNADLLFGPMIAFGQNPWGYADQQKQYAVTARGEAYTSMGLTPPTWWTPGAGTISYTFNGATGEGLGSGGTTLAAAITTATQATVDVTDITTLDVTTLPTRLLIGNPRGPMEEVRVCSKTQISGNHWQFGVCYDGRGWTTWANNLYMTPAQSWSNGTQVGQMKVTGTGTTFVTGSPIALCPGQSSVAPYSIGTLTYSTGTVNVTAGSATLVGVGTTWNGTTLPNTGIYVVRVQGTTSSTPFSFLAYVNSITDTTHITMSRVFPADADSNSSNPGLTYQIMRINVTKASLHYANQYSTDMQIVWQGSGCESDTQFDSVPSWDIPVLDGTSQTGKHWTIANNAAIINESTLGGVNFYGEDLMHASMYLSSGWSTALTNWEAMSDMWITSPYIAGCDAGGLTLYLGGGVIGAISATVLNISGNPGWGAIRDCLKQAENNIPSPGSCNENDTRNYSYYFAWIALGAEFDSGASQTEWQNDLGNIYTWEVSCKKSSATGSEHNSWANAGYKTAFGSSCSPTPCIAAVSLVNGSNIASGTGFVSGLCHIVGTGTITVTNGSSAATVVTGTLATNYNDTNGGQLIIEASPGNSLPAWFGTYLTGGSSSVNLSTNWSGASNTYTFYVEDQQWLQQIGTSPDDLAMVKTWGCTYISSTQLNLDRPWDGSGTSGSPYSAYIGNSELGYSQQSYMQGIKVHELIWASQSSVNPSGFASLVNDAATWLYNYGYDAVTQGLYYARVQQGCESTTYPLTSPPVSPLFTTRTAEASNAGCNEGLANGYIQVARNLIAEGLDGLVAYYQINPSPTAKTWLNTACGSLYGVSGYTAAGYYYDAYGGGSNMTDPYLAGSELGAKWPGFYFGMGMMHQCAAALLGGQPAQPRQITLGAKPPAGGSIVCNVLAPSSATSSASGSNTCTFNVDDRMATTGKSGYQTQILKILTATVSAGSFVTGVNYRITSIGTTDFTAIGASANTVGVTFVATGAGSGSGTANPVVATGPWQVVN